MSGMDLAWFAPLAGFALVSCGTPGPNNMLLTAAGAHQGVRRSLPLLLAVVGGLNLIIFASALGLGWLFAGVPMLQSGLKLAGSLYLLWLGWQLARAGAPGDGEGGALPRWPAAAALQLLNPKGWMMALSAIGGFTLSGPAYWASAWAVLATFFGMGLLTGGVWLLFGARLRQVVHTPSGWRRFNRGMGGLTVLCVLMLWR